MLKVIMILFVGLHCVNCSINLRRQKRLLKELSDHLECTQVHGSFNNQIGQLFNCPKVQRIAAKLRAVVQPTFDYLDENNDKTITKKELLKRTRDLRIHSTDLTKEENFKIKTCDVDGSQSLDFTEYAQCSVWAYGIPIMIANPHKAHNSQFSKTKLTRLINHFSTYSYKTISQEKQQEVIDSIPPEEAGNYSILDLARIDTELLRLYLVQLRASAAE